jgi:hypothetical protein
MDLRKRGGANPPPPPPAPIRHSSAFLVRFSNRRFKMEKLSQKITTTLVYLSLLMQYAWAWASVLGTGF